MFLNTLVVNLLNAEKRTEKEKVAVTTTTFITGPKVTNIFGSDGSQVVPAASSGKGKSERRQR
jgi:hypothetical protein